MSSRTSPTLAQRAFVALQHLVPQHFLSQLVYRATRNRSAILKRMLIGSFVRVFRPDMTEAAEANLQAYASFNEFFTRELRPGVRPIDPREDTLVSPVDGTISQIGRIDGSQMLQAKGHHYSIESLLDIAASGKLDFGNWAHRFQGGAFATLYLAPSNYHRIHMPTTGRLLAAWYVPGDLFSVSPSTVAAVPALFARNERVVCVFEHGQTVFAMVLVGALFVGSMATVWHGEITPRRPRQRIDLPLNGAHAPLQLGKGAEMGRFNMGSTVILLLPSGLSEWLSSCQPGNRILMGQALAGLDDRSPVTRRSSSESA